MKPVILIGLDAVEVTLIDELCRAGRLPVLAALREEGLSGTIEAAQQAFLSMVWPTCTTGKQTTHHAWYSNKVWNPKRMCLEHIAGAGIPLEPFWELLDGSGIRSALLDVPFAPAPSPGFSGVFLSGWQNHDDHGKSCFPGGFRRDLERRFGRPAMKPELFGEQSVSTLLRLREESLASIAQFAEICGHVLETVRPDLLFAVFGGAHRGGHYLWDDSQVDASGASRADRETIASSRVELYEACDRALGRVLERAPAGARVLVFALHGMGVNTGWPEQLARIAGAVEAGGRRRSGGGLVYRLKRAIPWKVARQVTTRIPHWANRALVPLWSRRMRDWGTVRWFPLPGDLHGFLKVNLKGRETPGVVSPGAEHESLLAELEESFSSFRDIETGAPIIKKVERVDDLGPPDSPFRDRLPDLVLHWSDEGMGRSIGARSELHGDVRWAPGAKLPSGRSGNHMGRGWFAARGDGIPSGRLAGRHDVVDIAPTVLRWLEIDPPRSLHGRRIEGLSGEPLQPPGSAAGLSSSKLA